MTMPGFTAEASVYKTSQYYRMGGTSDALASGLGIVPQQPDDSCIGDPECICRHLTPGAREWCPPGAHLGQCCLVSDGPCCSGKCCPKGWYCADGDSGLCCQQGEHPCGNRCCPRDQPCCGGKCCPSGQYCADGDSALCCKPGEVVSNGHCCPPGYDWILGKCYLRCGRIYCPEGSYCSNPGTNTCCPNGWSGCGAVACCPPGERCCGGKCCPQGQVCGSWEHSLCCPSGEVGCDTICCPSGTCRKCLVRVPTPHYVNVCCTPDNPLYPNCCEVD